MAAPARTVPGRAAASAIPLRVTDVKQFAYCPRITFYTYCQPLQPHRTYKMQEGRLQHEQTEDLEERRSLRAYGLTDGRRHFRVPLWSQQLGVSGIADMVIERDLEAIPVEFKNGRRNLPLNHRYQLTTYALLVEEHWRRPVRRAFLYSIPERASLELPITSNMRVHVKRVLAQMRHMIDAEQCPPGTRMLGRCRECEFLRFCNDRL